MEALDIVLVQQLLHRYGHIVDAAEWHRFDELFEPDCVLDYTAVRAPQVFVGIDEIRDYFAGANHPSAHHVTNVVVTADGPDEQTLRVQSKFFAPYTRATHEPHRWFGGDYDDVVVDRGSGWRFVRRVCTGRWQFTPPSGAPPPEFRRSF